MEQKEGIHNMGIPSINQIHTDQINKCVCSNTHVVVAFAAHVGAVQSQPDPHFVTDMPAQVFHTSFGRSFLAFATCESLLYLISYTL